MASHFQLRLATPDDAASISKLLYDAFVEFKPFYTPGGFAATTPSAEQVLTRMSEGPVWLVVRETEPLGTVAAVLKGESVYMRGMAVLPTARGLGVGAQLLETVEHWASKQGSARVFFTTTPFLHAAIRMYEKHGFRRAEGPPQELFGTPLFTMDKRISAAE
jgi:GNAT superfamily N-acetyltransferase